MNNYYIKAKRIFTTYAVLTEHYMLVKSGIIDSFTTQINASYPVIDYSNDDLIPGLIDLHIHGRNGCDVIDADMHSMTTISQSLAEHGVTGFLATTVTTDWPQTIKTMKTIAQAYHTELPGAQVLGGYSEGLFFSTVHKGAHNDSYFMPLEKTHIDEMIVAANGALKVVALAPEKDSALEMISYLTSKGIKVMLGHTDANFEQTQQALAHGASGGVHVFNGMRGIHHREPGCTGAVLMNKDAIVEVIADGVHLHPTILQLIYRLKGTNKITLISDCINAGGLDDGQYKLGPMQVEVKGGVARTTSGSLAGSTLTLELAIKNMHQQAEVELSEAIHMASLVPATFLGLEQHLGSLEKGKIANFSVMSDQFEIQACYLKGQEVFSKNKKPTLATQH